MLPDYISVLDWGLLVLGAFVTGFAKAGLGAVFMVAVSIFAAIFGGRVSASVVLPLMIVGDIFAMAAYHRKISWRHFFRLLPATIAGLLIGMIVGKYIPDRSFRTIMGVILLICLILMVIKEFSWRNLILPDHWTAHSLGGLSAGFTSMVGNAAGPIMSIYLLSMDLPKDVFIGTTAVFFMTVNLLKVPIHVFAWKTMRPETLRIDAFLVVFVLIGFFVGRKVVKKIPERPFRIFVIAATLAGAIKMFF